MIAAALGEKGKDRAICLLRNRAEVRKEKPRQARWHRQSKTVTNLEWLDILKSQYCHGAGAYSLLVHSLHF